MILSIENHCSVDQQHIMAANFDHHFGPMLLKAPINECETALPSPWVLRRKIIIKNRKLPTDQRSNCNETLETGNEEAEQDYDDKKCQGIFNYIGVDSAKYPKYVTLFDTGELQFSEVKNDSIDDPILIEDHSDGKNMELPESNFSGKNRYGSWFHGDIGRHQVNTLLKADGTEGAWLVRNSKNFPGDYTLSILRKNKVEHVRIIKDYRKPTNEPIYFLEANNPDHPECDSLQTLIDHYKTNGISSKLKLVSLVPVPQQHLRMPWFYERLDREEASRALSCNSVCDGQFLVRQKENLNEFGLSFRYDQDGPQDRIIKYKVWQGIKLHIP